MHQTSRVRNHGVPCDVPEGYRATRPGGHHDPGRLASNTSSTTDAYHNVYDGNWTYWFTADSFMAAWSSPGGSRRPKWNNRLAHTSWTPRCHAPSPLSLLCSLLNHTSHTPVLLLFCRNHLRTQVQAIQGEWAYIEGHLMHLGGPQH